jgi:hypothetical protein
MLLDALEDTAWFLGRVLADKPQYRPPYQQSIRQRDMTRPAGDVSHIEAERYALWVPKTVSPYMTWAYWWTRPVEPVSPQNAPSHNTCLPCRVVTDTRVHPEVYGRYIGRPPARTISPVLRYRVPRPVLAEITDRVHRPCESRTGLCARAWAFIEYEQ